MAKKIGVALSGSGFLLPAHVGALCALEDLGYKVTNIAGTSGGAIVAAIYASGMSCDAMHKLLHTTDFSPMMRRRWWGWWNGLCDPGPLYDFLHQATGGKTFHEAAIPVTTISSDLSTGRAYVFDAALTPNHPLALGARASSSIPYIYPAVTEIKDHLLVDGGVVNNIPLDRLSSAVPRIGFDIQVAGSRKTPDTFIQFGKTLIEMMLASNENARIAWAEQCNSKVIPINVVGDPLNNNMTKAQVNQLFNAGYVTTFKALRK